MKAYRIFEWKQPACLVDIPVPEPGPGQVRLKVAGNGICQSDLHLLHEWEASPSHLKIKLPMTIGHEVGGWIDTLGSGVDGFEKGQAAIVTMAGCGHCRFCAAGWNNYCLDKGRQVGMGLDGGLAEYVVAPAGAVVPVNIDPADAAPLTDAALSSYHAVKRVLPLLTGGTTVAVIGVGGLGHLAIQELKAMTPARVAGATVAQAARMIRPLGHVVVVGRGPGVFDFTHHAMPYGAMLSTTFGGSKAELMELIGLAEAGLIAPHTTRFALDDVEVALQKLAAGEITGRAVVVP